MTNPIAVVTGGSRGIGRSIVLTLAQRGFDVVFTYFSAKPSADEVVAEVQKLGRKATAHQLDVGNVDSFADFAKSLTVVHALVHNGATGGGGAIGDVTPAAFDRLVNEHFKGPFFLTQALLPKLADGARVVNITTGLTRYVFAGQSLYSAVKAATESVTRGLAVELGGRKITVNAVAPGGIATDFGGGLMKDPAMKKFATEQTPLGRMGEPDDIANTVAFLVSPEAAFVTGQRIELTGGFRL